MVTPISTSTPSFQGNPPFLANNKWGGGSNYGTDIGRLQVVVKPENYKIYFFVRGMLVLVQVEKERGEI